MFEKYARRVTCPLHLIIREFLSFVVGVYLRGYDYTCRGGTLYRVPRFAPSVTALRAGLRRKVDMRT
jgi:hypothetical protein